MFRFLLLVWVAAGNPASNGKGMYEAAGWTIHGRIWLGSGFGAFIVHTGFVFAERRYWE